MSASLRRYSAKAVIRRAGRWERRLPSTLRRRIGVVRRSHAMSTAAKKAPASKAAAKKSPAHKARNGPTDAVKLLTSDHREVKALFQQYQEMVDHDAADEDKHPIAQQICLMLTVHAQIEEEIFYPAARDAIREEDLVDEATVEHATAKDLIAQLEDSDPSDDLFDAKVKVLGEYIDHHVKEEESEMFPQARKAKMDLKTLGDAMSARKRELMEELGLTTEEEEPEEVAE
jgi:hemerythrin superfamily protein